MGKVFQRYTDANKISKSTPPQPPPQTPPASADSPKTLPPPPDTSTPSKELYEEESEKLGFFGLAKNLATSLVTWNRAGRPVVTSEQWNARLAICRGCNFWEELGQTKIARCKKCGCSSGKLLLATSKCPLNPPKWKSV